MRSALLLACVVATALAQDASIDLVVALERHFELRTVAELGSVEHREECLATLAEEARGSGPRAELAALRTELLTYVHERRDALAAAETRRAEAVARFERARRELAEAEQIRAGIDRTAPAFGPADDAYYEARDLFAAAEDALYEARWQLESSEDALHDATRSLARVDLDALAEHAREAAYRAEDEGRTADAERANAWLGLLHSLAVRADHLDARESDGRDQLRDAAARLARAEEELLRLDDQMRSEIRHLRERYEEEIDHLHAMIEREREEVRDQEARLYTLEGAAFEGVWGRTVRAELRAGSFGAQAALLAERAGLPIAVEPGLAAREMPALAPGPRPLGAVLDLLGCVAGARQQRGWAHASVFREGLQVYGWHPESLALIRFAPGDPLEGPEGWECVELEEAPWATWGGIDGGTALATVDVFDAHGAVVFTSGEPLRLAGEWAALAPLARFEGSRCRARVPAAELPVACPTAHAWVRVEVVAVDRGDPLGEVAKTVERKLDQTLALALDGVSLDDVAQFLRRLTGLNIVLGPEVDASMAVTLHAEDLRVREALDRIAAVCGLRWGVHAGALVLFDPDESALREPAPFPRGPLGLPVGALQARLSVDITGLPVAGVLADLGPVTGLSFRLAEELDPEQALELRLADTSLYAMCELIAFQLGCRWYFSHGTVSFGAPVAAVADPFGGWLDDARPQLRFEGTLGALLPVLGERCNLPARLGPEVDPEAPVALDDSLSPRQLFTSIAEQCGLRWRFEGYTLRFEAPE